MRRTGLPGIALLLAINAMLAVPCAGAEAVHFVKAWGGRGAEPGQLNMPIGIAINTADEIFVTDRYNDRIQEFAPKN